MNYRSLGVNVSVSDIHYRNIYTWKSNQMMMIKSRGGSGSVTNVLFESFIGKPGASSSKKLASSNFYRPR